jgi:adenine-specific DNA-methyltransferase
MLIHGDNLLALKAIEQKFAGKIKCIYIDPPFNTGGAFEHYDDNVEHSLWLKLMRDRLRIIHNLLAKEGAIVVNLDDSEAAYCKVLLDEIFGRKNYITTIIVEGATPSSFKTVNVGPTQTAQFLLFYAKDKTLFKYQQQYVPIYDIDLQHFSRFIENFHEPSKNWRFKSINDHILDQMGFQGETANAKWSAAKRKFGEVQAKEEVRQLAIEFALENCHRVFETKTLQKPSKWLHEHIAESLRTDEVIELKREGLDMLYLYRGRQVYFLGKGVKEIDGERVVTQPVSNIWLDIPTNNLKDEGSVDFPAGKKPENLIRRVIQMIADRADDWVLDSFLGSGTTAAVAHKMGRKWIGIELGDQCDTHCLPRLQKVCDGTDQGGISKAMEWRGGGGFKYYDLAPSLLKQDKHGNFVISEEYNADMLAAAMAKQEGFTYAPSQECYWKQGFSTEQDFIFTTTNHVTQAMIDLISEEMAEGEHLLICCKKFSAGCDKRHSFIQIKKIPAMLMGRCEFGKEDYSFNIVNLTDEATAPAFVPQGPKAEAPSKSAARTHGNKNPNQMELF